MKERLILFMIVAIGYSAYGQVANFSLPSGICANQTFSLQNTSTGAAGYVWDFCQDGLNNLTATNEASTQSNTNIPVGYEVVYDQGQWFGFSCSRDGGAGVRIVEQMSFGNSLTNSPVSTDISGLFPANGISDIKFVYESGNWYGFAVGFYSTSLTRIDYGSSLINSPVSNNLGNMGIGTGAYDIFIVKDGANYSGFVTNYNTNKIYLLDFGSSILNTPIVLPVTDPGGLIFNPVKIEVLKQNSNWYGLVTSLGNNKVLRLDFGTAISNAPVISYVADIQGAAGLSFQKDGDSLYGFVFGNNGTLTELAFGTVMSNTPTIKNLGLVGSTGVVYGFSIIKDWPSWKGLFIEVFSKKVHVLTFQDQCSNAPTASIQVSPTVQFPGTGSRFIELAAYSSTGVRDTISQKINIQNLLAPAIDILVQNECVDNQVFFTQSQSSGPAVSNSSWDFGDGQMDAQASTSHVYSAIGGYSVTLNVLADNGCSNNINKSIAIYNKPVAGFVLPNPVVTCTNQEYTFSNSSVYDAGSTISWQWSIDGVNGSNQKDLIQSFPNTSSQSVQLIAAIPGCSSQTSEIFTVQSQGPTTDFAIDGKCEQTNVQFINQTSGAVTNYVWDFGDGSNQNATDANHIYLSAGSFNVKLVATNASGCNNSSTKALTIYSSPQPNFSLDLPPFSCSGTPSQFNDLTPSPTDSNLSSWAWSFGDAGTSTDRNPLHTFTNAGDYNVLLTATTNFGCSASFQKPVTITASPAADFTYTPACINQGTRFADASGPGVKSWFWTIGSSTYAFSNPTHVFSGAGGFSAKLTVTGNNNCVASVTKTINVPVPPLLSFSVDNACEKQAANFKDTSPANTDPAASWSWDFAGQGTATGNAAQYSFANAGSYSVKMTSTQQSGCVYSLSKNVMINATPVAAFTSSPEWGVPPLAVQFTNTSTGANSYSWHFNDKNNSTSTLASPGFVFTDLGDYVVDLVATSALGCSGSASGKISVIIPSLDLELKQLQLVKDPASNVYRIFVTVKNKSNYLLTSVDVVVDISGNALIKETINTSLLPDAEIVQLLNNQILPHGNLLTYLCASIEVDNDNDPFNNSKCEPVEEKVVIFNPYPNPSNGAFRFEWIAPTTDNAHFEIFNAMGQLAFEQYAESVQVGLNQVQFDLSNLNTGAYYFRFSSNSVSRTLPIQIVR